MITIDDLTSMGASETKMVREFIEDEDRRFIRKYLKRFPNWIALAMKSPSEESRMDLLKEVTDTISVDAGYELSQNMVMSEIGKAMISQMKVEK